MRILLAEDEISLAKAIKKILQSNNYEVDSVDNGDDAIYYLLSDNYDIAIIDIIITIISIFWNKKYVIKFFIYRYFIFFIF